MNVYYVEFGKAGKRSWGDDAGCTYVLAEDYTKAVEEAEAVGKTAKLEVRIITCNGTLGKVRK